MPIVPLGFHSLHLLPSSSSCTHVLFSPLLLVLTLHSLFCDWLGRTTKHLLVFFHAYFYIFVDLTQDHSNSIVNYQRERNKSKL